MPRTDLARTRECRLIVPLVHARTPLDQQANAAFAAGADLVEIRADLIGDWAAVEKLLAQPHEPRYVLTIRTRAEGGAWDGDEAERIARFEQLGLMLPGFIDLEYQTWTRSANLRQKIGLVCRTGVDESTGRIKNRLILSSHHLRETPSTEGLHALAAEMLAQPAEIAKIACFSRDACDAMRILGLHQLSRAPGQGIIALGLGEAGLLTRVLAPRVGLWGVYASLAPGNESAPGQPIVSELLHSYHWRSIGAQTRAFGVIGWPVAHSRSPLIHNVAMRAAGIDGVYLPLPVEPDEASFERFMALADDVRSPFAGFSVTIPHKEHALQWARRRGVALHESVRCGALNTLVRHASGEWSGHNTDGSGAWAAIVEQMPAWASGGRRMTAAVLGAGGAARAIVATLIANGMHVTIHNRTLDRAEALAAALGGRAEPWDRRNETNADLIVNCTSVGMSPNVDETPLKAECIPTRAVVFDTIYNPPRTRLLREAAARGCVTIDGVNMFVHQAQRQFELWHAQPAPANIMREALNLA